MLQITYPWALALLLPVAGVLWMGLSRSLADWTPAQRFAATAARAILCLALVLALAGVRFLHSTDQLAVVYLVDNSGSISPEAAQQARSFIEQSVANRRTGDQLGVIGFAKDARVWQELADSSKLTAWPQNTDRLATDLGAALDFAAAVFPVGAAARLVLLSDGNDTEAGGAAATARLAARGLEISTVPLRNPERPEVSVKAVELPRTLKSGEPFDLGAVIQSNVATPAKVNLYQNQFLLAERPLELRPGANRIEFPRLTAEGGFASYEVEVVSERDTLAENNRAVGTTTLSGEPKVLLVDSEEAKLAPLAGALRAGRIAAETRGVLGLPRTLEELQQFDLVIFSDVPALNLAGEQMEPYRRWVQDFGGGFIMCGGENSFGVGGYFRTPIEAMLPVRMEHDDRQETPSVALLVSLDRSGSMSAQVQGQTKISLAAQGAVLALEVMPPRDYFGLDAVDTEVHHIAPLGRGGNKAAIESQILALSAGGGGIYVYTALQEAARALREVNAKVKHVILFSDAADAEEKSAGEMSDGAKGTGSALDLASALLAEHITTSVVGLGFEQDSDTAFLRALAERGNGRFYLTNDALTLPQIFSTETMRVAQSSLVEEPFAAKALGDAPAIAGIGWAHAPLLLGYNATKLKPTASLLLATENGDPLLASWRYGLGQAAAFTSDAKSRWASEWLTWDGYGKFWTQLVRATMRKSDQHDFRVEAMEARGRLRVQIEAVTPEGFFRDGLPIAVSILHPNGETNSETAQQIAPGSYEAEFALPESGTTMVSVSSRELGERPYVFGYTRSYPREWETSATDEEALRRIAEIGGGTSAPTPAAVFAPPKKRAIERYDLTNSLLVAAIALLPIDIWLRRRTWRRVSR